MRRLPFSRSESAGPSSAHPRRVRPDQIESLAGQARDVGAVHTAVDELIRMVNVTRVWKHWHKPVLIVVSRDAPHHYTCLREAFSAVPWADVVIDRRDAESRGSANDRLRPDRRQRTGTAERLRPWAIVHADRIEMEAAPCVSQRSRRYAFSALPRLLRWTWNTGWKIGRYAAGHTLTLPRG